MPLDKFMKDGSNKKIAKMSKDKCCIDKVLGDISKSSASKQLVLGASSGWMVGYISSKVGKHIGILVGGGIILLEIAHQQGYININWNKVNRNIDKLADKVEEKITGEKPGLADKVERYVDRKLDKAEDVVKGQAKKAKKWYSSFTSEDGYKLKKVHIFLVSFIAGVSIGVATA